MKEIDGLWALNAKKGTLINNRDVGNLPGGTAVPINERQKNIAKHLIGVVILDKVIIEEVNKSGGDIS